MEESMSRNGRPRKTSGTVYRRPGSGFWYVRYRDREGKIRKESTGMIDQQEAERFLRDRLDARDEGKLPVILASKNLTFDDFAAWFIERRSKLRAEKTHSANLNALKFLGPAFGSCRVAGLTPQPIRGCIRQQLPSRRRRQ